MARKTVNITITDEGRDKGKVFVLTEMPATQAEKWGVRALQGLVRNGIELPEEAIGAGIAGIAIMGLKQLGSIPYVELEPLMDEMMRCVQIMPDPAKPMVLRSDIDNDIEEVGTRLHLRMEVFQLITNFSFADLKSKLKSAKTTSPA